MNKHTDSDNSFIPSKDTTTPPTQIDLQHAGLTDDERASREDDEIANGGRVTPGPADIERTSKTK